MFDVSHQMHKSTFLVCKNEGNKAASDSDSDLMAHGLLVHINIHNIYLYLHKQILYILYRSALGGHHVHVRIVLIPS